MGKEAKEVKSGKAKTGTGITGVAEMAAATDKTIYTHSDAQSTTPTVQLIQVKDIIADKNRGRVVDHPRDGESVKSMAESIRVLRELKRGLFGSGVLEAVTVTSKPKGGYTLIDGFRRLYAADLLKLKEIPAVVVQEADTTGLSSTVKNTVHTTLNTIDVIKKIEGFRKSGMDNNTIMAALGVSQPFLAQLNVIAGGPPKIKAMLASGEITQYAAYTLISKATAAKADPEELVDKAREKKEQEKAAKAEKVEQIKSDKANKADKEDKADKEQSSVKGESGRPAAKSTKPVPPSQKFERKPRQSRSDKIGVRDVNEVLASEGLIKDTVDASEFKSILDKWTDSSITASEVLSNICAVLLQLLSKDLDEDTALDCMRLIINPEASS